MASRRQSAPGQAVRIFTGAPVPKGADTIVIQEDADHADGVVSVARRHRGRHIRPRGQDFKQGEMLLGRARGSGRVSSCSPRP